MADLSVIYRISADITGLQNGVNRAAAATEKLESNLASVGKALLSTFSATTVLRAIQDQVVATVQYADALTNLSKSTGLSVQGLQRLESIGVSSGVTMETLARAANALNRNLDDKAAQNALRDMNLNFEELARLSPDARFVKIARALAEIKDPVEKANAGAALFGKTWDMIAPAITADIDQIIARTKTLTDDQIAATDSLGDEWDEFFHNFSRGTMSFIASIAAGDKAMNDAGWLGRDAAKREAEILFPTVKGPRFINEGPTRNDVIDPTMISQLQVYGQTLEQTTAANKRLIEATKLAEKARADFLAMSKEAMGAEFAWQQQILLTKFTVDQLTVSETQLTEAVGTLADFVSTHQGEMFPEPPEGSLEQWKAGELAILKFTTAAKGTASFADTLNKSLAGVERILAGVNNKWAEAAVVGSRAIQDISAALKKGDWVGAIVAATAALVPFIAKLFGASEESKKVSPMRDEFFKLQGGLETLNPKVQALEGNLEAVQAVFDAKTVQQYEAAVANLNRILAQDSHAFDTATDAVEDYAHALKQLPSKIPMEGGFTVPEMAALDVPHLAGGGIVTQPTLAMIGEAGPELVTPLSRLGPAALQTPGAGQPPVIVNLSIAIDGVFSEGDLVQTVQRRVAPILAQTIEDNVAGSRTRFQDVLGVP